MVQPLWASLIQGWRKNSLRQPGFLSCSNGQQVQHSLPACCATRLAMTQRRFKKASVEALPGWEPCQTGCKHFRNRLPGLAHDGHTGHHDPRHMLHPELQHLLCHKGDRACCCRARRTLQCIRNLSGTTYLQSSTTLTVPNLLTLHRLQQSFACQC